MSELVNNQYTVYLEDTFNLANTLRIKLNYVIDSINSFISLKYPGSYNASDPRSWKYYQNVSGEYFTFDTPMIITSLDTQEDIVFSKDSLAIHKSTLKAYQYGSRYYHELVSRYLDQENLILGILYPIDIDRAIAAKEGAILGYNPAYLEENEYSFISHLQTWMDGFIARWVNPSFSIAHDLYYTSVYSVMYSMLPQAILDVRHTACGTNEAHSFHVKQFLASHGKLDRYYDQMTLKQSLWLYKNLLYVKKNLGAKKTFSLTSEHIMSERSIPLASYSAKHNVATMPTDIYPTIQFEKKDITRIPSLEATNPLNLTQMLLKEEPVARLNYDVRVNDTGAIKEKIENSQSNTIQTKTLESVLFDYTGSEAYSLADTLMSHWIYLSYLETYHSFIQIDNPKTGASISLDAKDAFILAFYLFCDSVGIHLATLPSVIANRVQRMPVVQPLELYKMADASLVDLDLAYKLLEPQPVIDTITSVDDFYNLCEQIFKAANYQHALGTLEEHYYSRSLVMAMGSRIYQDVLCDFGTDTQYSDWFRSKSIDIDDYLLTGSGTLWTLISRKALGLDLVTTNSIASIQKAMTAVLTQLSSYSLQFISTINESSIKIIEFPTIRLGDVDAKLHGDYHLDHYANRVLTFKGKDKNLIELEVNAIDPGSIINFKGHEKLCAEVPDLLGGQSFLNRKVVRVKSTCAHVCVLNLPEENTEGIIPMPGVDSFTILPKEERDTLRSMY